MSWHLLSPDGRPPASRVEEVQGLYGAYSFSEKLLQKIWLRGDFDRRSMITLDGRRLRLAHAGKWNLLGGPDFKDASLVFDDGPTVTGDIELHLRAEGWADHGHAADRAYDRVILHVVLFPPDPGHLTRANDGRKIPVLVLLPLLHHDLEQFAAEEAVEALANRPASRLLEELGALAPRELVDLLRRHARQRWEQKVRFARLRCDRLGWVGACHCTALEILGYRFNRAPMLRIAAAVPPNAWSDVDLTALLQSESAAWSVQGVRPANYPSVRLRQYVAMMRRTPHWWERLATLASELPDVPLGESTARVRRVHRLVKLRERFAAEICSEAVAGTRLDNLVCDGFLPLLAASTDRPLHGLWFHWYAGDQPPLPGRLLRGLGLVDRRRQPLAHGLVQGVIGWRLERETNEARPPENSRNS